MTFLLILLPLLPQEYTFVPSDRTPANIRVRNKTSPLGYIQSGYIDENGTFVCEQTTDLTAIFRTPAKARGGQSLENQEERNLRKYPAKVPVYINVPRFEGESVYEYRSGKLVPGYLSQDYRFIPEEGERILDFKEYQFSEKASRIYNLPGKYMTSAEYQMHKQEKR